MFIFRFEHDRSYCAHEFFNSNGQSLTGHGTFTTCENRGERPNFGLTGMPPLSIMEHERCAVTAEQFNSWIGSRVKCINSTVDCSGENYCYACHDDMEETDWRIDRDQVVFTPEYAINMGVTTVNDVYELMGVSV